MEPGFTFVQISFSLLFAPATKKRTKNKYKNKKNPEENTLSCRVIQSVRIGLHIIYTDRHLLRYY